MTRGYNGTAGATRSIAWCSWVDPFGVRQVAKQIPELVSKFTPENREDSSPGSGNSVSTNYFPMAGAEGAFAPHFAKLHEMENNGALVPEGSDAPSTDSIAFADRVLQYLLRIEFVPSRVVASAEGGVAICFLRCDMYSDIECLNSGEILGVISNRKDRPTVWELERDAGGIARAVTRIREFFNS
jgi:hypothetical protein